MNHSQMFSEATAFFDAFVEAFAQFDGPLIAHRYRAPYLAVKADGSAALYATPDAVGRYFAQVVAGYHAQGWRTCGYRDLALQVFSACSALATVTWVLRDAQGAEHSAWRESYTLVRDAEGWRIVASMDHAALVRP